MSLPLDEANSYACHDVGQIENMKAATIASILILVAAIIYLGYQLQETRKAFIATQVRSEVEKVKARALAFYQLELGRKSLDYSIKGEPQDFELRIVIPMEKEREFKEWMKGYGFDLSFVGSRNREYWGLAESESELYWKLKYK